MAARRSPVSLPWRRPWEADLKPLRRSWVFASDRQDLQVVQVFVAAWLITRCGKGISMPPAAKAFQTAWLTAL